jgi:hypothetical protein
MKQYSFLNTLLLVNGVEISGYDEGDDVIILERLTDSASHKIGTDGEMTVSISADRSGTLTFRLMQSSASNTYLSGLIGSQENGLFVPVFSQFKDTEGLDLVSGTQGYINRPAGITRGTNANSQEWVITMERLDFIHGG